MPDPLSGTGGGGGYVSGGVGGMGRQGPPGSHPGVGSFKTSSWTNRPTSWGTVAGLDPYQFFLSTGPEGSRQDYPLIIKVSRIFEQNSEDDHYESTSTAYVCPRSVFFSPQDDLAWGRKERKLPG